MTQPLIAPKETVVCVMDELKVFMEIFVFPARERYEQERVKNPWKSPPVMEELKEKAKEKHLWNLFLPPSSQRVGFTNEQYAPMCEIMGWISWAPEVFNCSAPDTGNMETLIKYGTEKQKQKWLQPLLDGEIRSAFLMTEPDVASSDARNIKTKIAVKGETCIINGTKWWASGIGHERCSLAIVMGQTDLHAPPYRQQSMILVPTNSEGFHLLRMLPVMGFDDSPKGHGEVELKNVQVPTNNLLLGVGKGFEVAQGRLGPGRIHHCMRLVGVAEMALDMMCKRLMSRVAFGQALSSMSLWEHRVAHARTNITMLRTMILEVARKVDQVGGRRARREISMIKLVAPKIVGRILDDAIQAHGAAGLTTPSYLAHAFAHTRALRFADGPDEVHARTIAKIEWKKYENLKKIS